MIKKPKK